MNLLVELGFYFAAPNKQVHVDSGDCRGVNCQTSNVRQRKNVWLRARRRRRVESTTVYMLYCTMMREIEFLV